ncbi:MAG TPA: mycothiol synthase [Marmoricola sp.]|nr:mycothiol synthase [Marmoricola sp.]
MTLYEVSAADFTWADEDGPAGVLRRITALADQHDQVSNLNEAALLALRHLGLHGARLFVSDEVGFGLLRAGELDLVVAPQARGNGHGTALLGTLVADVETEVEAWSHVDHPAAGALARSFDFNRVRDLWVMGRDLSDADPSPTNSDVGLRRYRNSDLNQVVEINRLAFTDHPEQGSLTAADFEQRMAESWFDADGLILAELDSRVQGFHWTKIHPDGTGEVYVVAVRPEAAGRGIGAALTSAGLTHLRERGCTRVILYVDADNSAAVGLYQRLGFTRTRGEAQYRRFSRG